jgi:Flp pilus assembly protein CpaB
MIEVKEEKRGGGRGLLKSGVDIIQGTRRNPTFSHQTFTDLVCKNIKVFLQVK